MLSTWLPSQERHPSDVRGIKAPDGTEAKEAEEAGGKEPVPGSWILSCTEGGLARDRLHVQQEPQEGDADMASCV
jgi:hypothetical protein